MKKTKPNEQDNAANNAKPPEDVEGVRSPPLSPMLNGGVVGDDSGGQDDDIFSRRLSPEEKEAAFAALDRMAEAGAPPLAEDLDYHRVVHVFGSLRRKVRHRNDGRRKKGCRSGATSGDEAG